MTRQRPRLGAAPTGAVNIVGFLQVFINQAFPGGGGPKAGEFQVTVVNVSGLRQLGYGRTGLPPVSRSGSPDPLNIDRDVLVRGAGDPRAAVSCRAASSRLAAAIIVDFRRRRWRRDT